MIGTVNGAPVKRGTRSSEVDSEYFARALEQVRTKLLDQTRRTRLLNFKESGRDVPIVDEMPNQVHAHLVVVSN
jgi:hypothetical protein